MKKQIFLLCVPFMQVADTNNLRAQNFMLFKNGLAGKSIVTVIESSVGPPSEKSTASNTVNEGAVSITINNDAVSENMLTRAVDFKITAVGVSAERSIKRIRTQNKGGMMDMTIDTDEADERPEVLSSLGEAYDKVVKKKMVSLISGGINIVQQTDADAEDYWNNLLPFLTLDSALNCIIASIPAAAVKGFTWNDSVGNKHLRYYNTYRINEINSGWATVICNGTNIFTPSEPVVKSDEIDMKIHRLSLTYNGTLLVNLVSGFIKEANFSLASTSRKYVMGQKIDNDRSETVTLVNTIR